MLEADSGFNAATKVFELKVGFAGAVPWHLNLRFVLKTQPSIHQTKSITKLPSNVVSIIFCFREDFVHPDRNTYGAQLKI